MPFLRINFEHLRLTPHHPGNDAIQPACQLAVGRAAEIKIDGSISDVGQGHGAKAFAQLGEI
jgi:hypothetical protein